MGRPGRPSRAGSRVPAGGRIPADAERFVSAGAAAGDDGLAVRYVAGLIHCPASPTMPTGTAPDRLTFCTLGPAATMVVSCRIGSTVDMFHNRGSNALIT